MGDTHRARSRSRSPRRADREGERSRDKDLDREHKSRRDDRDRHDREKDRKHRSRDDRRDETEEERRERKRLKRDKDREKDDRRSRREKRKEGMQVVDDDEAGMWVEKDIDAVVSRGRPELAHGRVPLARFRLRTHFLSSLRPSHRVRSSRHRERQRINRNAIRGCWILLSRRHRLLGTFSPHLAQNRNAVIQRKRPLRLQR